MIERTLKWPLVSGDFVDRWVSQSGKLIMLGDAAHAMVPYMSQGEPACPYILKPVALSTAKLPLTNHRRRHGGRRRRGPSRIA